MNLSHHAPTSYHDPTWIDQAIKIKGENEFWKYINKVYALLDKMDVGQSLPIEKWVQPENFDLFIKTACFYISESKCCYQINPEHTIIKHTFDATEMERKLALFAGKRQEQITGTNGEGIERIGKESEINTAPISAV